MKTWLHGVVLLAIALSAAAGGPAQARPILADHCAAASSSYFIPEVRLRKLHLVRPDLIPYPIDVETVC